MVDADGDDDDGDDDDDDGDDDGDNNGNINSGRTDGAPKFVPPFWGFFLVPKKRTTYHGMDEVNMIEVVQSNGSIALNRCNQMHASRTKYVQ